MSQIKHLATLVTSPETAVFWINQQLSALGMVIKPSFDLQVARLAHPECTCPYHGTAQCDCQIMVLLVYDGQRAPITLVVHSQDGRTYLSMTESPDDEVEKTLAGKIIHALGYQNIKL